MGLGLDFRRAPLVGQRTTPTTPDWCLFRA
jgi:hypothetical protein